MEFFSDPVVLARIQFAATAMFHFILVPLSVGIGLIMAINETRYYRSRDPKDAGGTRLWIKIFAATFIVGVATGITMEFMFGTNWADYSRFVGDIFGAPLAAEALFAFFLESVFLGILVFGRKKVSAKFYVVSAWLTWLGACLSALWILIANSWQQTPAGSELSADGTRAVMTDFIAAAFLNPSLATRYTHTVLALLVIGAFVAMAIAAWYMYKKKHPEFALRTMKYGAIVGVVTTCLLLVSAHASVLQVADEQPTKFAMMEGMYEDEAAPLYLLGWVDEEAQKVITPFAIEGGGSFLLSGTFDHQSPGLNTLTAPGAKYEKLNDRDVSVNLVFQSYHLMVIMLGLIALILILTLIFTFRRGKITNKKWLQRLLIISPIFPMIAIQSGWITAEYGRQPWVVYPSTTGPEGVELLTNLGISQSVSGWEVALTLALFILIYLFLIIALFRVVFKFIKQGPVAESATNAGGASYDDDGSEVSAFAMAQKEEQKGVKTKQGSSGSSNTAARSNAAKEGE